MIFGTRGEVRETAKRNCEVLTKDGDFVFVLIHSLLSDFLSQNIDAMYEVVNSIGC